MSRKLSTVFCLLLLAAAHPGSVLACAACYGQSDSEMATGMNWGIFSLMGVIVLVLGCLSTFFVFLVRRAPMMDNQPPVQDGTSNLESDEHGKL